MYPFGKKWHKWAPYGFLLPALIIYIVFSFGPSMVSIIYSFTDISGVAGVKWHFIGFDNYNEFFHSGRTAAYLASAKRTVIFFGCHDRADSNRTLSCYYNKFEIKRAFVL